MGNSQSYDLRDAEVAQRDRKSKTQEESVVVLDSPCTGLSMTSKASMRKPNKKRDKENDERTEKSEAVEGEAEKQRAESVTQRHHDLEISPLETHVQVRDTVPYSPREVEKKAETTSEFLLTDSMLAETPEMERRVVELAEIEEESETVREHEVRDAEKKRTVLGGEQPRESERDPSPDQHEVLERSTELSKLEIGQTPEKQTEVPVARDVEAVKTVEKEKKTKKEEKKAVKTVNKSDIGEPKVMRFAETVEPESEKQSLREEQTQMERAVETHDLARDADTGMLDSPRAPVELQRLHLTPAMPTSELDAQPYQSSY